MTLRFALVVAPIAALSALGVLISGKRVRAWNRLSALAERYPDYYRYWSRYIAQAMKRRYIGEASEPSTVGLHEIATGSDEILRDCLVRLESEGYDRFIKKSLASA